MRSPGPLHCFCENFPEYSGDIKIQVLKIVYSIPQHIHDLKIANSINSQTFFWRFFCLRQKNSCSFWPESTVHVEDGSRE